MAKDQLHLHAEKSEGRRKKILLAEDDADIRFIISIVLNDAGYDVETLFDGQTILAGSHESPDLFILDKALPTIDGLALCKYLKSNEKTKGIPIIMISCYHEFKRKAKLSGVDDFIEKPFDLSVLRTKVDKNIKRRARRPANSH
jgi:DNA-binding response OmpR family regulator